MGSGRDVLLFDLDGTLVDSAPAIATALTIQRERRGLPPLAAEQVRPWISLGADMLVARGLDSTARNPAVDLGEFRIILGALPADSDSLYPGVVATLAALAIAGAKMAVVTNKPEGLSRQLLSALGIATYFEAVIGGDTTPHAKPHPAPLLLALELLGATVDGSVFIGDSDIDCEAARRLGMPFILFARGYGTQLCRDEDILARFEDYAALSALIGSLV